ncbi:heme peroxidase [Thozetella sp. PMI_491]|nr:heme peroxidase [Thozetella sp. PMI_491]
MEFILVEQALPFTQPINPCSTFIDEIDSSPGSVPLNTGEQSSAEWVRLIFHDFITADIATGTGGIDASIGFESERVENIGKHFINDTLLFFNVFVNAYVSLSDMIALGGIMSLRTCSGLDSGIELKVGRIDATKGGPSGVPQAFTDLATTLETFRRAGFNQTEAITAVACGHSLGGVHHVNFPDIVGEDIVTVNNLSTLDVFHNQCGYIFQRMIDTVPKAVTLSEPVVPRKWKIMTYNYELAADGTLSITGRIRYLCGVGLTCPAPPTLSYNYDTLKGPTRSFSTMLLPNTTGTISGNPNTCISSFSITAPFFGNFSYYCFFNNITSSTTAINVQNEYSYSLFPSVFVLKSNSSITQATSTINNTSIVLNTTLVLSAAALSWVVGDSNILNAVYYQKGTGSGCQQVPFDIECTRITESEGSLERIGTVGDYTVFAGNRTWAGGAGLQAVQVGFRDVWSRSVETVDWRIKTIVT